MQHMDHWEVEIKEEADCIHPNMDFIKEENFLPVGHCVEIFEDIMDIVRFTSNNMHNVSTKSMNML